MCVDGAVMTIWSFSHIYYELSNHTDIYLENILHINHFPPSLPLAQHCGCADWPLDTHCHPNCSHLPGLRIPMKRHSHKHRNIQLNIHATNTRTAMTSCMVSWRCMWAVKGSEQSTLWSMWLKWFLWAVDTSWWSLLHNLLVLHLCGRLQYPSTQIHLILSLLTLLKF